MTNTENGQKDDEGPIYADRDEKKRKKKPKMGWKVSQKSYD